MDLLVAAALAISLGVPGRSNTDVTLAARGHSVVAAWTGTTAEGLSDVYVATSADDGATFGSPVRVNDVAGQAKTSGEQPPRVTLVAVAGSGVPRIQVVWTAQGSAGGRLLTSHSDDGGRTFAPAAPVPGSDAPGNRGWESVAPTSDGSVTAVWLDHRDLAPQPGAAASHAGHAGHDHMAGHASEGMAAGSKLLGTRLDGGGQAQVIAGGVCYCCKTAIAASSGGVLSVAWRQVYDGNIRDIAFSRSTDNGRTYAVPVRVSEDRWVLNGCPDDGPSVAVDGAGRVHILWPTLVPGQDGAEPALGLFYSSSSDGRTFAPRTRVAVEGVPHHPQIAATASGRLVFAWDEVRDGVRRVVMATGRLDGDGRLSLVPATSPPGTPSSYPALSISGDDVLVAWTAGAAGKSVINVERLGVSTRPAGAHSSR